MYIWLFPFCSFFFFSLSYLTLFSICTHFERIFIPFQSNTFLSTTYLQSWLLQGKRLLSQEAREQRAHLPTTSGRLEEYVLIPLSASYSLVFILKSETDGFWKQGSNSGGLFSGLMNQKRNSTDAAAAARRQSFHDQKPQAGIIGKMWHKYVFSTRIRRVVNVADWDSFTTGSPPK